MKLELKRLYDATDNLVNQQFYLSGQDLIIGRTPDISIKINKSGQVVSKYKEIFNKNMHSFLEGQYKQFLLSFKVIKGIDDKKVDTINKRLYEKLASLDTDFDIVVTYTIVLNGLITEIRDLHFNAALEEIKRRVKARANLSNDKIQEELDLLFMKNNKNVSILYNISYLDALADSFNYRRVAHTCKIQKGKFINQIVKIILSSEK